MRFYTFLFNMRLSRTLFIIMDKTNVRMRELVKALGYKSMSQFEKDTGFGQGFVIGVTDRIYKSSLQKIADKFPNVNISWIKDGKGNMFLDATSEVRESMDTRLDKFLKYKGMMRMDFTKKSGVVCAFTNGKGIQTDTKLKINAAFPELNIDWLITGDGEMLSKTDLEAQRGYKARIMEFCNAMGLSQRQFLLRCEMKYPIVSKLAELPKESYLRKFKEAFKQLNIEWLKTGKGNMLIDDVSTNTFGTRQAATITYIPLVPYMATAGYLSGYSDDEYIESLPTIPLVTEGNGKYVAFEVNGNSMDDGSSRAYQNGDIVICKLCTEYFKNGNHMETKGREFIIVHKEGILLKCISSVDKLNGRLTLHAFNPSYRDVEVDMRDVMQVLVVEFQQKKKK